MPPFSAISRRILKIMSSFMKWNKLEVYGKINICTFPTLAQEHPVGFFDGEKVHVEHMAIKGWTKVGFGTNVTSSTLRLVNRTLP